MLKFLKWLSATIIFVFLLSFFSNAVFKVASGGSAGVFTKAIEDFSYFPITVRHVLASTFFSGVPAVYKKADPEFEEMNKLDYDLYALNSFWNIDDHRWDIRLFNFKNDEIIHEWHVEKEILDFTKTKYQFTNSELRNCLLNNDKSVIAVSEETPNMFRLDESSNLMWRNGDMVYHHSLNFDADSNVWACGAMIPTDLRRGPMGSYYTSVDSEVPKAFRDDYLVQVDRNTGETLFKKGVAELLVENGYQNFVFGVNNPVKFNTDPIHLNDIEPALEDGTHWKKGDLFVSIRHRSLVFQYRPSTNEIIRLIFGPLLNQHDVDILNDSTLTIFNNNLVTSRGEPVEGVEVKEEFTFRNSEVYTYSLKDGSFRKMYSDYWDEVGMRTVSQGFQQTLSNGDMYVESENQAKMYIVNKGGFVMKKVFHTSEEGYVERPNWVRLYETLNFR